MNAVDDAGPLADPVAEARRLIAAAAEQGLLLRALGGVAVYLVAATANDQSDLYSLLVQYDVFAGSGPLDASFVAGLCARDWGLWRTCTGSIDRLLANLESSPLDPGEAAQVQARLEALRRYLEAEPKTMKWRLRSQVGDKVRWYQQPEEEQGPGVRTRS